MNEHTIWHLRQTLREAKNNADKEAAAIAILDLQEMQNDDDLDNLRAELKKEYREKIFWAAYFTGLICASLGAIIVYIGMSV